MILTPAERVEIEDEVDRKGTREIEDEVQGIVDAPR